jgi:hypothetical protein
LDYTVADSLEVLVVVFGGVRSVIGCVPEVDECGRVVDGPGGEGGEVLVLVEVVPGAPVVVVGVGEVVAPLIGDLVGVEGGADILWHTVSCSIINFIRATNVAGSSGGFLVTTGGTRVFDCDGPECDCPEDVDRETEVDCADVVPGMMLS